MFFISTCNICISIRELLKGKETAICTRIGISLIGDTLQIYISQDSGLLLSLVDGIWSNLVHISTLTDYSTKIYVHCELFVQTGICAGALVY